MCSPAYRINIRSIREFYETKITFTSTRDENVIRPLRDTADRIFEQLQNEECSLAHLVRALSILFWLVEILEYMGISLDRQTQDEVDGCARALTGEYLRRGGYNVVDVFWAVEWASKRTIEEMAPQVPDSFFEKIGVQLTRVVGLGRIEGLAGLAGLEGLGRLGHLGRLADLVRLVRLTRLGDPAGLQRVQRFPSNATYMDIPQCASIARLALDDTPESKH